MRRTNGIFKVAGLAALVVASVGLNGCQQAGAAGGTAGMAGGALSGLGRGLFGSQDGTQPGLFRRVGQGLFGKKGGATTGGVVTPETFSDGKVPKRTTSTPVFQPESSPAVEKQTDKPVDGVKSTFVSSLPPIGGAPDTDVLDDQTAGISFASPIAVPQTPDLDSFNSNLDNPGSLNAV